MADADPHSPAIRPAVPADLAAIVEFNRLLALETESKVLDPAILESGVACALADPDRLRYWVAELDGETAASWARPPSPASGATGARAGSGGSRASTSPHRSAAGASSAPCITTSATRPDRCPTSSACGSTSRTPTQPAQRTYQALGMKPGGYSVYQELWIAGLS